MKKFILTLWCTGLLVGGQAAGAEPDMVALGELLFFDTDLSKDRTQACATCHDPSFGFVDPRDNGVDQMASMGDDQLSIGDRQAPSAAYAMFSPGFHLTKEGKYKGGQFWDGRAGTLADQAGGPPLNPIEMGMPDKAAVVARLKEKSEYVKQFQSLFGTKVFEDEEKAYAAMTQAIQAFEKTQTFAPFDSKYDRFLRGEVQLSPQEELGRVLFFSQQFTNCNTCHQLRTLPGAEKETFSNYEFHNIGVPANEKLRAVNNVTATDDGLLAHPDVSDVSQRGKYKVPTLRNVAVTGPYMHNGVFKELRTVVKFYNKFISKAPLAQINPETGKEWASAEVPETISETELKQGKALNTKRINALVAFMETLTDARYEHLLQQK